MQILGLKGYELPSTYYVDNLLYPNSVNTAPLGTIEDWIKTGKKDASEIISEAECDEYFATLAKKDINMEEVYSQLLEEGLDAFKVSFIDLLAKLKS